MSDSLTWLRDPRTEPALSDLLCGLIRDIRLILGQPDLGNAAKLGAITEAVDQLAPPPGLAASAVSAASVVAALLGRGSGTATALFEELAGEPIRIELTGSADRPLTAAECLELHASPGTLGRHRTGTLRTAHSGLAAAQVSSIVVPGRLPVAARRTLGIFRTGEPAAPSVGMPLGTALASFGVRREPLGARMVRDASPAPGSGVSVASSARLWLDGVPVALASERVTTEFCQRASGQGTGSDGWISRVAGRRPAPGAGTPESSE